MNVDRRSWALALTLALGLSGCTIHHSRQALWSPRATPPSADATFVTEEDSGLSILGVFQVSDPDHYAVLLERARRRHSCQVIHHAQLDFYTDHWLLVGFPIARMTMLCEREPAATKPALPAPP
jgi:hypothetical protein